MHNKSLLLQFASAVLVFESISIRAQTVTPSTNYVATGQRLLVTGSGFTANEVINVFVADYRSPMTEIMTDSNGCFTADLTYGGPYLTPNVEYRLNPQVEGPRNVNAYYQAAEIPPRINGFVHIASSNAGMIGETPSYEVRISANVGRGGNSYDILTSANPTGPWQSLNLCKTNNSWGDTNYLWDFTVPQETCRYFRVKGTQCCFQPH